MTEHKDHFFDEFPPVSTEEWEKVIKKDLRGADYKEKLRWDTGEGFDILPFYRIEDIEEGRLKTPILSGNKKENNSWYICAPIFDKEVEDARESMHRALERGADALELTFQIKSTSGMLGGDMEGTSVQSQNSFEKLFRDVNLSATTLVFDSAMATPIYLAMLQNLEPEGKSGEVLSAIFSYDPFVYLARKGQLPKRKEILENEITDLVHSIGNMGSIKPLSADGRFWHNAGGTIVQELGLSLAAASEYLALLTDRGVDSDTAARSINFMLATGSKYFPEIAKFRTLRLLWKQLLQAYEADEEIPAYIHAETSLWNKTVYDPYVNMLRSTTEGMSAAIGGIDSLTVHPFDRIFEKPDDFSERIARNTQIIMQEESYFDKVTDPAAGSYYIEMLTDKIAEKAWSLFQEIELEGGLLKSLQNGTVQVALENSKQQRDRQIASRGRVFVGTNKYPNAGEKVTEEKELSNEFATVSLKSNDYDFTLDESEKALIASLRKALSDGAALGDLVPKLFQEDWSKQNYRTVQKYRGSEAFEELRMATEKQSERPKVLTLPLGNKKMRKARSSFTSNFFACAGYEIKDPIGFESVDEAVEAVREHAPDIAVICSSDEGYIQLVPDLCSKINQLDEQPIMVLAGYPKEELDQYRKDGIEEFIHAKSNVLVTLKDFHSRLGINERE
ncbi:methylmalonyl-CoA mutase small subunit [Balneolaceae bacterium YR4-1]|uniref:methylmalonyl-CoA mutase n=1 Tax=Halalkalibaculum roseum TaxID=2709311 RepID=A0A6M1T213_9BACT|nr:methylmalonyl-CoA mutase family protein [Halalkalibaculum roseum]NGP77564.1 methylmalonyl-CoA mutase small subunit [Halalkalibaculum roseum]